MALRLPPGMARLTIPKNPDPAHITETMWEFSHYVVALESNDFVFAGIFDDKSGYHNTVKRNLERWPGEYSTRLAADRNGVKDKSRALDIKSKQAASGAKPTIMAKYGARMREAARAHDSRVIHWREILGQFDIDKQPEAIDFQSLLERVPDSTHEWHFHWSILAMYVAWAVPYEGMLSVLWGESYASWMGYVNGSTTEEIDMQQTEPLSQGTSGYAGQQLATAWAFTWQFSNEANNKASQILANQAADEQRDSAVLAAVQALAINTGADPTAVVDAINAVRNDTHALITQLQAQLAEANEREAELRQRIADAYDKE